jgi:hypothetical protein
LAAIGTVTATVLILTASLTVLWPMLIGCACITAIGLAIFAISFRCRFKRGINGEFNALANPQLFTRKRKSIPSKPKQVFFPFSNSSPPPFYSTPSAFGEDYSRYGNNFEPYSTIPISTPYAILMSGYTSYQQSQTDEDTNFPEPDKSDDYSSIDSTCTRRSPSPFLTDHCPQSPFSPGHSPKPYLRQKTYKSYLPDDHWPHWP